MKRIKKKLLSFLLAFTLIVTAVPGNGITSAQEVKAAETDGEEGSSALVKWKPKDDDTGLVTFSEDQAVKTTVIKYGDDDFYYGGTLTGIDYADADWIEQNDERIQEVFGMTGTVGSIMPNYDYFSCQWYEVAADGKRTKLEGETSFGLKIEWPFWAEDGDITVTNAKKETTFVCVLTLNSVRINGADYEVSDVEGLASSSDISMEHQFKLQYTGGVIEKSEVDQYFDGVEDVKDEIVKAHTETECYESARTLRVSELSRNDSDSYFNYRWTVHYADGSEDALIDEGEHNGQVPFQSGMSFYHDGKQVSSYECEVDLCYGYQVIDTVSKKFVYRYAPFDFHGSDEVTQPVRNNATAEMEVDAWIEDTNAVVPGTLSYQWYRIDADGEETKLTKETASSYIVRIPDPSVKYKVEVRAQKQEGFDGPEFSDVLTRTFHFEPVAGYLLKDISPSSISMNIGDTEKLYVTPKVDKDYKLEYEWEKVSYEKDEDGNDVYDEETGQRKIVSEVVSTSAECEVAPEDVSDFETIYQYGVSANYQDRFNYRVTVKVTKDDEVAAEYVYTFWVMEDISLQTTEASDYSQSLDPGDDLELYVKAGTKDCYTLKQTWYKKAGEGVVAVVPPETDTGEITYVSADEDFEVPENFDWAEQKYYEKWDPELGDCYQYAFWEKVGEGDTYTKKGKASGKVVDVRGEYRCRLELYRAGEEESEDGEEVKPLTYMTRNFKVSYDSDLSAYAKSIVPSVKKGETAKLRVVAQTKSDAYKIHYKWEKQEDDDSYTEIEDHDSPVYTIKKASAEDAGRYRVTVTDEYDGECSPIYIWLSVQGEEGVTEEEVTDICYTPSRSTYELGMGDKADLKLDMKLSDPDASVFYAWYRDERVKDGWDEDLYDSYESDWELLGEDKNTYKLTIRDEDDFTTYKCMAVYRKNSTEYTKREVTFTVRRGYTAELEKMTLANQIKKRGDKASYTVRLITDDPKLSVKYQWYRLDGNKDSEIAGATKETYEIAQMKQGDFGTIYCIATDAKTGEQVTAPAYFKTSVYRNGAYLEKNRETVEASIGDATTVLGAPVISRAEGLELTYQWYRNNTIIYGATKPTYTIEEIGDNEFLTYRCEICAEGDYLADYYTTVVEKEEEGGEEEESPIDVEIAEGYETKVKAFLGSSAKFAVKAKSNKGLALHYQWYCNKNSYDYDDDDDYRGGYAIGGATAGTYEISAVTSAKKGTYYCIVMDEEGNRAYSDPFILTTTTGLDVETEGYNSKDAIGVQTSFGAQGVVLTATAEASTEHGYKPFYQWYHETINEKGLLYGETSQTLTLPAIDEDALGMYYCVIKDSSGADYTLKYYVYVNNGLNAAPSTYYVLADANGLAKMYVTATANAGCEISYQWSKYLKDEDGDYAYIDIEGAEQSAYVRSPLTSEDYGLYRCRVSTIGEKKDYFFSIQPGYLVEANREFARQGDQVTVMAELENPASDRTYSYQWYEQEPATGTYRRIKDGTGAALEKTVPAVDLSEQFTGSSELGYVTVGYRCVVTVKDGEDETKHEINTTVRVLPDLAYRNDVFPETNHPNDKSFDLQAYRADGAEQLRLTFDAQTELGSAGLYLIDNGGSYEYYDGANEDELAGQTITIPGDSVILLMNGNRKATSYGYKVTNIEPVFKPQPGADQPGAGNASTKPGSTVSAPGSVAAGSKSPAKKGSKYTIKNLKYKVTSASKKKKTVTVTGGKSKKLKSVTIPATVKISGVSYKVTAVSAKAFQGYSKLTSVTVGKNVKSIGASAFAKDKKLKSITIKGKALKSIGKKAFASVPKKAAARVPKKSKKAFKKLFKKGGFKGKVK